MTDNNVLTPEEIDALLNIFDGSPKGYGQKSETYESTDLKSDKKAKGTNNQVVVVVNEKSVC